MQPRNTHPPNQTHTPTTKRTYPLQPSTHQTPTQTHQHTNRYTYPVPHALLGRQQVDPGALVHVLLRLDGRADGRQLALHLQ